MPSTVLLSVIIAMLSALFYALSSCLVRVGIKNTTPIVALFISLTVNMAMLWLFSFLSNDMKFGISQWHYFIMAGLFAPLFARFFYYSGIHKIGINVSAPITYANPLVSLILAIIFLNESLSFIVFSGAFLVILGGILLGSK